MAPSRERPLPAEGCPPHVAGCTIHIRMLEVDAVFRFRIRKYWTRNACWGQADVVGWRRHHGTVRHQASSEAAEALRAMGAAHVPAGTGRHTDRKPLDHHQGRSAPAEAPGRAPNTTRPAPSSGAPPPSTGRVEAGAKKVRQAGSVAARIHAGPLQVSSPFHDPDLLRLPCPLEQLFSSLHRHPRVLGAMDEKERPRIQPGHTLER